MADVSSHRRVRAHRERLRAQGLRPVQIWVPDVAAEGFAPRLTGSLARCPAVLPPRTTRRSSIRCRSGRASEARGDGLSPAASTRANHGRL